MNLNKFEGKKSSFYLKFPSALQFSNKIHCVGMPDTIQVDMNSSMRVSNELPNVHFDDMLLANQRFSGLANSGSEAFNY